MGFRGVVFFDFVEVLGHSGGRLGTRNVTQIRFEPVWLSVENVNTALESKLYGSV